MTDDPIYEFLSISPAPTPANAVALEFQKATHRHYVTVSKADAELLLAKLEQYLRSVDSTSTTERL